jgi:hypothetical protein
LANSQLTDAQKALASAGRAYESVMNKEYAEGYDFDIGFQAVLGNNIKREIGFDATNLTLSENAVVVVKYTDANGNAKRLEVAATVNAQKHCVVSIDTLTAVEGSTPITCELRDGGVTIAKATYSVESYVHTVLKKCAIDDPRAVLASALMKYCDSAKAYFAPTETN